MLIQWITKIMYPRIRLEVQLAHNVGQVHGSRLPVYKDRPRRLRNPIITVQVNRMPQQNAVGSGGIRGIFQRLSMSQDLGTVVVSDGTGHFRPQYSCLTERLEIRNRRRDQPIEPVAFQDFSIAVLTHRIPFATRLPDGTTHNTDVSVGRTTNYFNMCNVSRTLYPKSEELWPSYAKCRNSILGVHSPM
jgi:hypothetical protein